MFYKVTKRIFDFICALIGIIGTSPLWIVGIIGILISDWGPVFYTARRIGKNNKPFKMYKFRSMRVVKAATEASLRPDEDRIFPIIGPRPVAQDQFDMFRYGKWNEAAKVPVGLIGPAALYDFIYGDQIIDEKEYMEKVYPTRRELEYTYVRKAGIFYDLKMIVYTVVCILYAVCGKECTWMLNEFVEDAKMTMNK